MTAVATIDDYIRALPDPVRGVVEEVRRTIHRAVPDLEETIRYGMPTFTLEGRSLVHVAAWKHHLGIYPLPDAEGTLAADLNPYRTEKGTGRFPLAEPIPYDLIGRLVTALTTQRARGR